MDSLFHLHHFHISGFTWKRGSMPLIGQFYAIFLFFFLASFAKYHATFCVPSVCIVFTKNDSVLIQRSFLQVLKRRRALATGRARSSESTSKPILSP